ncbi:hypothetical protein D3C75_1289020 [compost metagenome]
MTQRSLDLGLPLGIIGLDQFIRDELRHNPGCTILGQNPPYLADRHTPADPAKNAANLLDIGH